MCVIQITHRESARTAASQLKNAQLALSQALVNVAEALRTVEMFEHNFAREEPPPGFITTTPGPLPETYTGSTDEAMRRFVEGDLPDFPPFDGRNRDGSRDRTYSDWSSALRGHDDVHRH